MEEEDAAVDGGTGHSHGTKEDCVQRTFSMNRCPLSSEKGFVGSIKEDTEEHHPRGYFFKFIYLYFWLIIKINYFN